MTAWFEGAGGIRLAADIFGPNGGNPLILVGGMGQTRHSWQRVATRLAEHGRRTITVDVRGHGESDRASDYSYPRQAEDIAAIVREIGRPVILCGNSLGGKICLAAAGSFPEVAAGLVLIDSVPRSSPAGIAQVVLATVAIDGFASPDDAAAHLAASRGGVPTPCAGEKLRRNMRQSEDGRWHWHWDASYRDPIHNIGLGTGSELLERYAGNVKCPVLLAWCELSEVVTQDGVDALHAVLPQIEVEVIAGARHMIVGDENDLVAEALEGFLERHRI
jgi:pimeloyl-ACP methyl ester carboxylesterase